MKVTVDRRRLRARMIEEDKNSLIRALKADDPKAAKQALTGMSGDDLGLSHEDFKKLTSLLGDIKDLQQFDGMPGGRIEAARRMLGVGKDTKQTTATHNPVTNQPWSSGPVKPGQKKLGTMTSKDFDSHRSQQLSPAEVRLLDQYAPPHLGIKDLQNLDFDSLSHTDLHNLASAIEQDESEADFKTQDDLLRKIYSAKKYRRI